jgi:hypothetical protein
MTEFAVSQNQVMGILRADIFWGVTVYVVPVGTVAAKFRIPKSADRTYFGLYMSTHDNIASCMMLLDVNLAVHLMVGGSSSLYWVLGDVVGASCGRETRWS